MNGGPETLAHRHGCTLDQIQHLLAVGEEMVARGRTVETTPLYAFSMQRASAKQRGIGWELTLWQWWTIWHDTGRWNERGPSAHEYVMCRRGDVGPYAIGNVFIETANFNHSDRRPKPWHEEVRRLKAAGVKQADLARRYGVSPARICQLTKGVAA